MTLWMALLLALPAPKQVEGSGARVGREEGLGLPHVSWEPALPTDLSADLPAGCSGEAGTLAQAGLSDSFSPAAPFRGSAEEEAPAKAKGSWSRFEPFVQVHGGVWASKGFSFDATLPSGFEVRSRQEVLWSAGADAGAELFDHYVLFATVEGSLGRHIVCDIGGVSVGYRDRGAPNANWAVPHEVTLYGGFLWGRFDVKKDGFGDFDNAFGGRGGARLTWPLADRLTASLIVEYRYMAFHYREDTVSGDSKIGASGVWGGLAIDLRF